MKKIIIFIFMCLLLTGCGQKENQDIKVIQEDYSNQEYVINDKEDTTNKEENITNVTKENSSNNKNIEKKENTTNNSSTQNNQNVYNSDDRSSNELTTSTTESNNNLSSNNETITTYSNEDKVVINTMEDINNNVDSLLKEGTSESVKDKAKGVFITLVDFVFYNGEINGITFEELTENGKEKVLQIIHTIDEKIENHFPGYKETISTKTSNAFNKASEVIKNGANNIKNFAREKLGDKYYQEIIDDKDEFVYYTKNALSIVGKVGSSLLNTAKDKLSSWYENFKNKN